MRSSLIKFALSFLMVGTGDTISTILETKGDCIIGRMCYAFSFCLRQSEVRLHLE